MQDAKQLFARKLVWARKIAWFRSQPHPGQNCFKVGEDVQPLAHDEEEQMKI